MKSVFICLLLVVATFALNLPFDLRVALKQKTKAEVWVIFKNHVDWKAYAQQKNINFDKMEENYRGNLVMDLLNYEAKTQEPVISFLKKNNIPFHSHVISNAISLKAADLPLLTNLKTQFAQIEKFELVEHIQLPEEKPEDVAAKDVKQIEAGVNFVKAPELWAKGVTGKGIVVGVIDTGAHLHNDLKDQYRGKDGKHEDSWLDTTTTTRREPYDDHFHGTHCHGTISGTSDVRKVGVAPEIEWISCKFLTRTGGGSLANAVRCFEFMLAPGKKAEKRAHIVSNSWGGGSASTAMIRALDAMAASGVLNVFAAGNSGRNNRCSSVLNPALIPSSWSVGALNRNALTLASFSSKGPGRNNQVKPEVSAPGVSVVSTSNIGNGYRTASGTSMACPHVAGVVALLWDGLKKDYKRNIKETRELVEKAATDVNNTSGRCPSPTRVPNNFFGHGSVDAEAAYEAGVKKSLTDLLDKLSQ